MEEKVVTNDRPEKYFSPANNIPDPHYIVQHDVIDALGVCQDERHAMHTPGMTVNYEKLMAAHDTMHRAHHHQPGEKGSSTWAPRSKRPGTIVRS